MGVYKIPTTAAMMTTMRVLSVMVLLLAFGGQAAIGQTAADKDNDQPASVIEQLRERFKQLENRNQQQRKRLKAQQNGEDKSAASKDRDVEKKEREETEDAEVDWWKGKEGDLRKEDSDDEEQQATAEALPAPKRTGEDKDDQDDSQNQSSNPPNVVDPARRPAVAQGRFAIPALAAKSTATGDIGNGSTPKAFQQGVTTFTKRLPESAAQRWDGPLAYADGLAAPWDWSTIHWEAANTFSKPRYFEDRMLERHGHQRFGDVLQPLASGVRFFSAAALLPYKMALDHPLDDQYLYGYFRSGSAAPPLLQRPPWDRRGVTAQSIAVTSGILIFP